MLQFFIVVKTGQFHIERAGVELREHIFKHRHVPFAAYLVQRDVERLFMVFVHIHNHTFDFTVAEVFQHFQTLVATDHGHICVDNYRVNIAKFLNAAFDFLIFGILRREVFSWIVCCGVKVCYIKFLKIHGEPPCCGLLFVGNVCGIMLKIQFLVTYFGSLTLRRWFYEESSH